MRREKQDTNLIVRISSKLLEKLDTVLHRLERSVVIRSLIELYVSVKTEKVKDGQEAYLLAYGSSVCSECPAAAVLDRLLQAGELKNLEEVEE